MKERDLCIKESKKNILAKMTTISSHAQYPEFIRLCIIESAMAMNEKKVFVQCRKVSLAPLPLLPLPCLCLSCLFPFYPTRLLAFALRQESTLIICNPQMDEKVVKAQLAGAKKGFEDIMFKASGIKVVIELVVDTTTYLPGPPAKDQMGASCCGGVVLHANAKKMICRNTLDSRLDTAFDALTPQVRGMLFGVRE
jgi:vacuolar-type H+-ATPase subunit E/Vma4